MDPKSVAWQSALVAIALLAMLAAIAIASILHYASVDDALKFWSALSGVAGLITGAVATYFFSRGSVQQAGLQANNAQLQANNAQAQVTVAQQALTRLAGELPQDTWAQVMKDPAVARALRPNV